MSAKSPLKTEFETLAVMFRTNDANLGHVSTYETMNKAELSYCFSVFMGIPRRWHKKRACMADMLAGQLDAKAAKL